MSRERLNHGLDNGGRGGFIKRNSNVVEIDQSQVDPAILGRGHYFLGATGNSDGQRVKPSVIDQVESPGPQAGGR